MWPATQPSPSASLPCLGLWPRVPTPPNFRTQSPRPEDPSGLQTDVQDQPGANVFQLSSHPVHLRYYINVASSAICCVCVFWQISIMINATVVYPQNLLFGFSIPQFIFHLNFVSLAFHSNIQKMNFWLQEVAAPHTSRCVESPCKDLPVKLPRAYADRFLRAW